MHRFKARTQCFSEKIFDILIPFENFSPGNLVVSKFLLEVPKFKENIVSCIIDVIKSFNHIFTSNSNTCSIVSKMNEHRLLILINISYMINY